MVRSGGKSEEWVPLVTCFWGKTHALLLSDSAKGGESFPRRCPRPWLRWEGLPTLSSLTAPDLHAPFVRGARKGCPLLPPAVVRPVPSPSSWREEGGRDAPCPCPLERCLRLPLLQTFTLLIRRACSRFSLRESRNEGVFVAFVPLTLLISDRKMGGWRSKVGSI